VNDTNENAHSDGLLEIREAAAGSTARGPVRSTGKSTWGLLEPDEDLPLTPSGAREIDCEQRSRAADAVFAIKDPAPGREHVVCVSG